MIDCVDDVSDDVSDDDSDDDDSDDDDLTRVDLGSLMTMMMVSDFTHLRKFKKGWVCCCFSHHW